MERDPYNEEMLRKEVIFLHSLWHQGPPPQQPLHHHHHHHHPPPQPPLHHHHHHHFFHPLNPPLFKKQKGRRRNSHPISTTQWPCPPSPPPSTPWPAFKQTQLPSNNNLQLSTPNLQSSPSGNRIHLKFLKEVAIYFKNLQNGSDHDDDDDDDEDMEIDDDSGDEGVGQNEGFFEYFLKLFEENEELKSFYEKNNEDGEFGCLVCGGVGVMRRFKNCVALVQHTQTISKTKTVKAHRAFGKVVCQVLGWDINKLPSIISSITGKKNETLSKLEEDQLQVQENVTSEAGDGGSGDKETGAEEAVAAEQLPDCCEFPVVEIVKDDSSIAAKLEENNPDIVQGSTEGSLVYLEGGPGNEDVGRDVAVCSANEKGKSSTGNEKLPITDILNVAQNLQSKSGVGRCVNDQLEETLDGKQENAESASNCLEPRKEEGNGKNESEDQKRSDSIVDRILMQL